MSAGASGPFSALLRRLRYEAKLTQEALAERAGISARAVSDLERGIHRFARRDTAILLADALALSGDARAKFLEAASDAARPLPHHAAALPTPPTPLIGRERELAALLDLITRADVRLVTLTGVGGIGKTRLALETAAQAVSQFPDGVWFVDLSPITEPALMLAAIADHLALGERPAQTLAEAVAGFLAGKRALLVLDNFEHLLGAVPEIAELLSRSPALTILVTSRIALHLRGEHVSVAPPFRVPEADPGSTISRDEVLANDAVTLFVQRARAVDATFAVQPENAGAILEICRRLDGLPLAIELAAARVGLLTPAAIVSRLDRRLALLTGGARDLPQRQQTLRNAIGWSYRLLAGSEQALFRSLSVFAGGATLDAAAAVCCPDDEPFVVMDRAAALVAWGLLRNEPQPAGEPRLRMLETIREYAAEQLMAAGEDDDAHQAHARYFLGLVEEAEPELSGANQVAWLTVLDAEQDNVRGALAWAIREGHGATALRLAGALWWFWETRGHYAEGRSWLERALAVGSSADPSWRAKALFGLGGLAYRQHDLERADGALAMALQLYRQVGDAAGASWCQSFQGLIALVRGQTEQSRALHEAALVDARQAGDLVTVAGTLSNLGEVAHAGGDLPRAEAMYEESLAVARSVGNPLVAARSLTNLGTVAAECRQPARAARLHQEALRIYADVGDRRVIASSLEGIAAAAASVGQAAHAARLYGAASAMRAAMGSPIPVVEQAAHEHGVAQARAALPAAGFERSWKLGHSLGLEDVIVEALELRVEEVR